MTASPGASLALPLGWDFARDLVVLVGRGGAEHVRALRAAGQQRILLHCPPEDPVGEALPPDLTPLPTPARIVLAVFDLTGEPPHHAVFPATSDPWATPERCRAAAQAVQDATQSRVMQAATVARFGATWLRHGLENLAALADTASVDALRGAFAGRPCLIASPGPSLSRNVRQLPALRDRVLLMAGTHCLGALHRVGVAPHLVVAADPGDLVRHYEGCDLSAIEALVVGATCHPESFRQPVRRTVSFASNGQVDDWIYEGLGEDARLASGGSVACSELSLALLLGCDPIVFIGQDLSFPGGRYYADECLDGNAEVVPGEMEGTFFLRKPAGAPGLGVPMPDGNLRFTLDQRMRMVPGYDGGEVPTSASFHAFLTWFAATVGALDGHPRVLNCTEGGAFLPGMEHIPLATAAATFPAEVLDVGPRLDRCLEPVPFDERRRRLAARLRDMVAALDPCLELAQRCTRLAAEAKTKPARLDELGRHEAQLSAALRPVRLFALVAQDEILRAQEEGRRATDLATSLAASRTLFAVVERAVLTLREPLVRALEEFGG